MIYTDYRRNHVIVPGREAALAAFLGQDYKGMRHKQRNGVSSNSEDALTWSCFDTLKSFPGIGTAAALDEILDDAFGGKSRLSFRQRSIRDDEINICIGRQYTGISTAETTEVDASIEAPGVRIFFEAKLYSAVSPPAPPDKPHDQIARKLRVGLDSILNSDREFYFVFLDLAPPDMIFEMRPKDEAVRKAGGGYKCKWRSAWFYKYYKEGRNNSLRPLADALEGIDHPPVDTVAAHMGWLTWADLYKCVMRAVLAAKS
jgi:hypothetical protein